MSRRLRDSRTWMVIDLQFGSTGKGLIAGVLAQDYKPDVVACSWTPNAGHTFIDALGNKYVHRALPNGIVSPRLQAVLLGPNSVIDARRVITEMEAALEMGLKNRSKATGPLYLVIHPAAMLLRQRHRDWEEAHLKHNGSTRKGSAAAQIEKIRRQPFAVTVGQLWGQFRADPTVARSEWMQNDAAGDLEAFIELIDRYHHNNSDYVQLHISREAYEGFLGPSYRVQIEGAQGYSLSLNERFYPFATGRDVSVTQIAADVALPLARLRECFVVGTCRTFPIRVNNREGSSGPAYKDQYEMEWAALGLEPELTTVTKLPRRLFTLSEQQLREASRVCAPDAVFMNFANYLPKGALNETIDRVERATGAFVGWIGNGPTALDVKEVFGAL